MRTPFLLLLCLLPACGSETPPPRETTFPDVQQLCRRLDRLLDVLERPGAASSPIGVVAPSSVEGGSPQPLERTDVDDDAAVLRRRIDVLEAEIRQLREAAPTGNRTGQSQQPIAPLRSDQVRDFIVRHQKERSERRNDLFREVLLKSPAQIVQRFGMPTESYVTKNGSLLWEYKVGDDSTTFSFSNGQLVTVW